MFSTNIRRIPLSYKGTCNWRRITQRSITLSYTPPARTSATSNLPRINSELTGVMRSHDRNETSDNATSASGLGTGNDQELNPPALTASEFREYNRLAEHMDSFHNHFRITWNELYATASGTAEKDSRLSPGQFLRSASRLIETLTMHHDIEETYVFPRLATRMPAFQKNLVLINQHKQIHAGMDKMEAYLGECRRGVRDMRMNEIKDLMDTWKDVLWAHLDKEVEELGAKNMCKYWSLQEVRNLGF